MASKFGVATIPPDRDTIRADQNSTLPRWISAVLGIWLFISAFMWEHSALSQLNTWVVGLLIAGTAIAAMYAPIIRYANTLLAAWLFFSTFAIEHVSRGTVWHNALLALIVLGASLVAGSRRQAGVSHRRPVHV